MIEARAKMASGAVNAAQKLPNPLLVPKRKIEASGNKMSGNMIATIVATLKGFATSKPRTCRIEGTIELILYYA